MNLFRREQKTQPAVEIEGKEIPPPVEITKKLKDISRYNDKNIEKLFKYLFWWVFRGQLGTPGTKHELNYADKTIDLTVMMKEKKNVVVLSSFKLFLKMDGKDLKGIEIKPTKPTEENIEAAENIAIRLNSLLTQDRFFRGRIASVVAK